MRTVNVHQAKTQFSRLIDAAHAGEIIMLAKDGKPWARLMPLEADSPRRQPGVFAGLIVLPDTEALLAPLPEEELEALGGGVAELMAASLLLDTHALLWWLADPGKLSASAMAAISVPAVSVFVSSASAWEIATKHRLGRLPSVAPLLINFPEAMRSQQFELLPIQHHHAIQAGGYRQTHRDPFDRLLAAQAELEGFSLVSLDPALEDFPCRLLW